MNYLDFIKTNKNYFEDFVTRSTYHSNAIEGSTLSIHETYALLFDSQHCNIQNASPREIYEAINHKKILTILLDKIADKEWLSHELIIQINQTIHENIMYVGRYRSVPIRIIGSLKIFPHPNKLNDYMSQFISQYNNFIEKEITMTDVLKMHNQYENIHPFPDGNGRTGRLLMNYLLLMKNQCPIVLPVSKRNEYLDYMENNRIDLLSQMFEELQKEEIERINDFSQM